MANPMRKCGCRFCRAGMRRAAAKPQVRRACRGFRHEARKALRAIRFGIEKEVPLAFAVPYTD